MAADLHIHVFQCKHVKQGFVTEEVLRVFNRNTLGSKHFDIVEAFNRDVHAWDKAYDLIQETPNIWVGEVSWLKAAIFEDEEHFIPSAVQRIHEIIGEDLPTSDDGLIAKIKEALKAKNSTSYDLTSADKIIAFLAKHKNEKLFTVSW